jgi:hypothetical protein
MAMLAHGSTSRRCPSLEVLTTYHRTVPSVVTVQSFPIGPDQTITDRPQVPGVVISLLNNPIADGAITGERTKELCQGKSQCNTSSPDG